jgi:transcriptional regulator with XRE-family HTH domain
VVRADGGLVRLIGARLAERGLSLRALARRAGVSHSTVSRLLRGQSRPTAGLLRALAPTLGVAPEQLLAEAGLPAAGGAVVEESALSALRGMGVDPAPPELVGRVREALARLREYAGTEEGRALVRDGLERKVAALGARGPVIERLRRLGRLYLEGTGAPAAARLAAGSAALYFLHAVDAIDDFIWPIGYIDDAVAIALAEAEVRRAGGEAGTGAAP